MDFLKSVGAFFDRLLPSILVDFMKAYPGLTVVASVVGTLSWGTLQRGLMLIGM